MSQSLNNTVLFEKLSTVSRANSTFELIWHLTIETFSHKTIVNILFKNVVTNDYIIDEIAPEYLGYCSVGSFFKGGKKLENHPASGVICDITINVGENILPTNIGSAISDTEYNLSQAYKTKNGQPSPFFTNLCKNQKCMVFKSGADKVVIPCSVIAATYYLTSTSMRVQLFSQNLHGLYEKKHFDASTETALIILHRNAKAADVKNIARFAFSSYATRCWDNVMDRIRFSSPSKDDITLITKIPVVQQSLTMRVRCHEVANSEGGTTFIVHEIQKEWSDLPFKTLLYGCRGNAPPEPDAFVIPELDAESDNKLTNSSPSSIFKGKQIHQYNVPNDPDWEKVEFIQIKFPALGKTNAITITEKDDDGTVKLSSQRAKGNDPNNRVAGASLDPVPSLPDSKQRMALTKFRDMVAGIAKEVGVTDFFISSDLTVPMKGASNRNSYTLRESYDKKILNRRHYLYVTFRYGLKFFCLVEFNQIHLSLARIGTYVMVASNSLGEIEARKAADDFVQVLSKVKMENKWLKLGVAFTTKSHPSKYTHKQCESWGLGLLDRTN